MAEKSGVEVQIESFFTEEQLERFDELTKLASSPRQMDRISARLQYSNWMEENNLTKKQTNAMHEELVRRGKW